jgi:glycosyltransferase involved in cell wall biosynthesis
VVPKSPGTSVTSPVTDPPLPPLPTNGGSTYFDAAWYLEHYPDVAANGVDPLVHFEQYGRREHRSPSPYFDPQWYFDEYPDVVDAECDPLGHYLAYGIEEDRRPNQFFDPIWYRETYPDVESSNLDPLAHFVTVGVPRGRWGGIEVPQAGIEDSGSSRPYRVEPWTVRALDGPGTDHRRKSVRWPRIRFGTEGQPTILVVDSFIPQPDQDAGSMRMFQILSLLRRHGWAVAFGCPGARGEPHHYRDVRDLGVLVLEGHEQIEGFVRQLDRPVAIALVSRPENGPRYIPFLRCFSPATRVVYDTVDIHWRRMERMALHDTTVSLEEGRTMRERERTMSRWANLTLVTTEVDAAVVASESPTAKIAVLPTIHEEIPHVEGFEGRRDLVFLGSFEHQPNGDAVRYFLAEIWPLVHDRLPEVRFHILGSKLEEWLDITATETVDPVGYVEDIGAWLSRARIMVVPLRSGSGMKGKIGSSMSHGLPVVTTSIGAEGMGLVNRHTALIADDPEAFAQSVVELYEDRTLWTTLSTEGKSHLGSLFSPAAVGPRLDEMLRAV